ncbi:D-alanyl-D-alanine carboxypeptidase (penicillin-binding protein 5/6) [Filibacter limicola]|uniref:serine-type D-Ala-D-Ala carboxypeptidase n=1 Tax=Sporosarcina limicola TaxID=34101 RepID=A0A927RH58_9BACL|nr:D-alanyl-D-alanine carboxypeptidase (penicillin-binding protein 5/6) [Sporosarcina limicola]
MKRGMRKLVVFLLVPLLLIMSFGAGPTYADSTMGIHVDGAILIDAENGKILYAENADTPLGIASMTKMMTEYLLFEAIKDGKISWDQEYKVNDYTYAISQDRRLSNVPLRRDGTYTIRELYEAVAIYSANAATIAVAETLAGTETEFLKMMNAKAAELGLVDYKFVNSTGLNNSDLQGMHPQGTGAEDENVMPAKSVAKLAYHLLKDYPEVLETTKINTKYFRKGTSDAIKMDNWNFMLPGFVYAYEGIDGLKTGTTDFAGHCFTGTAKRGDKRVISVVMKAVDSKGVGSYKARFDATRALFDYGFTQFSEVEFVPAGYQFDKQKTLDVVKGKEKTVSIAVKDPIRMMVKTSEKELYIPELVIDESKLKDGFLQAPIKKGAIVGHVKLVKTEGTDYGFIEGDIPGADVVASDAVDKAGWFSLMLAGIGDFFAGIWNGTIDFIKGLFK